MQRIGEVLKHIVKTGKLLNPMLYKQAQTKPDPEDQQTKVPCSRHEIEKQRVFHLFILSVLYLVLQKSRVWHFLNLAPFHQMMCKRGVYPC